MVWLLVPQESLVSGCVKLRKRQGRKKIELYKYKKFGIVPKSGVPSQEALDNAGDGQSVNTNDLSVSEFSTSSIRSAFRKIKDAHNDRKLKNQEKKAANQEKKTTKRKMRLPFGRRKNGLPPKSPSPRKAPPPLPITENAAREQEKASPLNLKEEEEKRTVDQQPVPVENKPIITKQPEENNPSPRSVQPTPRSHQSPRSIQQSPRDDPNLRSLADDSLPSKTESDDDDKDVVQVETVEDESQKGEQPVRNAPSLSSHRSRSKTSVHGGTNINNGRSSDEKSTSEVSDPYYVETFGPPRKLVPESNRNNAQQVQDLELDYYPSNNNHHNQEDNACDFSTKDNYSTGFLCGCI